MMYFLALDIHENSGGKVILYNQVKTDKPKVTLLNEEPKIRGKGRRNLIGWE